MLAQKPNKSSSLLDLSNWINSEDLSKCLCGVKYSIPGLDSSLCKSCGWTTHRHELIRQYCLYQHLDTSTGKPLKLDPNDLTEAQAKTILLKLTKTKSTKSVRSKV